MNIDILTLKIMGRSKKLRLVSRVLKEKSKFGGLMLCNFKTYYNSMTFKAVLIDVSLKKIYR